MEVCKVEVSPAKNRQRMKAVQEPKGQPGAVRRVRTHRDEAHI